LWRAAFRRWRVAILITVAVVLPGGVGAGTMAMMPTEADPSSVPWLNGTLPFQEDKALEPYLDAEMLAAVPVGADPVSEPVRAVLSSTQVIDSLGQSGIPAAAVDAYVRAANRLATEDPGCGIRWTLLAAIGRVESNHGRFGGAMLRDDGYSTKPIRGIPLDGRANVALIRDTDRGLLDGDTAYDRAVGPMQFIPSTWQAIGVDGNGDGRRDPDNIFDAAYGAARYLCDGDADLRDAAARARAVRRYNNADEYVRVVLNLADMYETGAVERLPAIGLPPMEAPAPPRPSPGPPPTAAPERPSAPTPGGPAGPGTPAPRPPAPQPAPTPSPPGPRPVANGSDRPAADHNPAAANDHHHSSPGDDTPDDVHDDAADDRTRTRAVDHHDHDAGPRGAADGVARDARGADCGGRLGAGHAGGGRRGPRGFRRPGPTGTGGTPAAAGGATGIAGARSGTRPRRAGDAAGYRTSRLAADGGPALLVARDRRRAGGPGDEAHVDAGQPPITALADERERCPEGFGSRPALIRAPGVLAGGDDGGIAVDPGLHLVESERLVRELPRFVAGQPRGLREREPERSDPHEVVGEEPVERPPVALALGVGPRRQERVDLVGHPDLPSIFCDGFFTFFRQKHRHRIVRYLSL
jgi:hypothetical protein